MGETNISWTHQRNADGSVTKGATWNPVTGCSHVSAGCLNCYAETWSLRRGWSEKPWSARNAAENVRLRADRLEDPLHWRRPRIVFVNSMSDLFHELVPFSFIAEVFTTMGQAPRHTFQVLTKRPARVLEFFDWNYGAMTRADAEQDWLASWPNVWLGVSVEDQKNADERIPLLLQTPAAVRFLSCEPLLGPMEIQRYIPLCAVYGDGLPLGEFKWVRGAYHRTNLDWVIAGGESGPGYRPMDVAWARSLRGQCAAAGVPFFMKQQAGLRPGKTDRLPDDLLVQEFPHAHEAVPA